MGLAQSSSDGSFSVRHAKHTKFSLKPAQMRQAESLYQSACTVVRRDFNKGMEELHPRFTVVIGADRNEVRGMFHGIQISGKAEIWMKKWNPMIFAQGVVVLAFDQILTPDVIAQLGSRVIHLSNAEVNVADLE
jgi:hypothetical protein